MKQFSLAQIIRLASYLRVNSTAGSERLKQFRCVYCVVCRQCLRVPEWQESSCFSKEVNTPSTSRLPEPPVYLWTSPWQPQPRWTERYSVDCRRASRLKACGDCPGVVWNLLTCWFRKKKQRQKRRKKDGVTLPRIPRIWRLKWVSSQLRRFWGATDLKYKWHHPSFGNRKEKKDVVTLVHMFVGYNGLLCSIRKAIGRIC